MGLPVSDQREAGRGRRGLTAPRTPKRLVLTPPPPVQRWGEEGVPPPATYRAAGPLLHALRHVPGTPSATPCQSDSPLPATPLPSRPIGGNGLRGRGLGSQRLRESLGWAGLGGVEASPRRWAELVTRLGVGVPGLSRLVLDPWTVENRSPALGRHSNLSLVLYMGTLWPRAGV